MTVEEIVAERVKLAKRRGRPLTSAQVERLREMTRRNKAIQEVGPRPVDGVTFGAGKLPKA